MSASITSRNCDVNVIEQPKRRNFRNRFSLGLLSISPSSAIRKSSQTCTSPTPNSPTSPSRFPWKASSMSAAVLPNYSSGSVLEDGEDYQPVLNLGLPPTTNDLDSEEKAILLKKTRKLSRVFGETPLSVQQASTLHSRNGLSDTSSSGSSTHRRSISTLSSSTATSQSSRGQRVPRKMTSQPDVKSFTFPSGNISPKAVENNDNSSLHSASESISSPMSQSQITPEQIRRLRLAKLRRHLGADNLPSELVTAPSQRDAANSDDLRFRQSLDAMPSTRSLSRPPSVKRLRRTRSNIPEVPHQPQLFVDDPVAFHRRYVQNFGEGRVTQATRKQQVKFEQPPPRRSLDSKFTPPSISTTIPPIPPVPHTVEKEEIPISPSQEESEESAELTYDQVSPFQERRRRATKLAQFFGVGYQDLSASLPVYDLVSPSPASSPQSRTVQVDIAMRGRRFWGGEDWTYKDADMVDVIDKLRDLKV